VTVEEIHLLFSIENGNKFPYYYSMLVMRMTRLQWQILL